MYHLSSPSVFDGNFSSTDLNSASASSSVGSRGIGSSLLVILSFVYRELIENVEMHLTCQGNSDHHIRKLTPFARERRTIATG
jgi:hypothetical protein